MATSSLTALLLSLTTILSGLTAQLNNLQIKPASQVAQVVSSSQKSVLSPSDFTYLGYYDVLVDGNNTTYSGGLTHRYVNGQLRLLILGLSGLKEMALPSTYGTRITNTTGNWTLSGTGDNLTGFWWDEAKQKLWVTSSIDYGSSNTYYPTKISTVTLGANGPVTNIQTVSLQGISSKRVYGGALALPTWFQTQYGCGPYAVGFGGYTSLMDQTSKASLGPELICIPDISNYANGAEIPTGAFKVLLDTVGNRGIRLWTPGTWPSGSPVNYFDGGDTRQNPSSRPSVPPASGAGYLSPNSQGYGWMVWGDSYYNTGMWIDTATKHGYVAVAALCKGFCWYQSSTLAFDGRTQELHIWDPNTLGNGLLTRPTSMTELNIPRGNNSVWSGNTPSGNISGATYDSTTGRMYLYGSPLGPDVYTGRIYVYQVAGGGTGTPPPPSPTGTATDAVVSSWSAWTDTSGWSTCVNGTQTKTQQRTRTVITAATNGGYTPHLIETQTISQSCTTAPTLPVQTNPVGYWKLDETSGLVAIDSSGNGNNGALNNGPVWTTGKKANGLSFDGSDDHVLIGNPATLIPGSYITMMGWAKYDRIDLAQAIVSKYGNDSNITQLRMQGPGEVRCSVGGTTLTTTGAGVTAGNWHHLACTYDGSNITVYVDGVVKGTMSKTGSIADSAGVSWRIGSLDLNLMYQDGVIDEVKIYNRALSASEIATEISSASAPTSTTDTTSPTVSITSPTGGTLSGTVSVSASASDNVGVVGVQFKINGNNLGSEDTTSPYSVSLDTTTLSNATHTLTAVARDSSGNSATSQSVFITVSNVISNPQPTGNGTGLLGEYYDDYKFLAGDLRFTRVDPTIDFDWGAGSPSTSIASDSWGVVWKGKVEPRYSQSYTFIVNSDDGTRLWVNNQQIINDWNIHPAQDTFSTPISLVAGQKYDIRLEYHDSSGNASSRLYWQSASQAKEIIPATQLTPATVTTTPTTPTSTKFSVGATVQTTANVNVRSTPSTSGSLLGTQSTGSTGTVVGGPTYADGLHWWQINYSSGADGWSAEDFLVAYSAPTPTDAVVSDWSAWTDTSGWSTCVNGTQTKTQQRTRTVITAATNGGSTPALSETRTISQSCTTTNQDAISPVVSITSPVSGTQSGIVNVNASASDNVAVAGVQFRLNGVDLGSEDTTSPYSVPWDTATVANGVHQLNAVARDTSNNTTTSATIFASVNNLTTTKFNIGDNIQTTANVNVRAVGGGTLLGTQPIGSTGKIIAGPTYSNGVTWWQIDYTSGVDGWSGDDYLVLYDASGTATDAVVSDWSAWTDTSGWSTCVNGTQTKTQQRTRTVITAATNGGSTPALIETQTISQSCMTEGTPTSTKFSIGDNVETIANVNVRSTPSTSGSLLGTQTTGMTGKVVSGPVYADGLFWWQIDYADGADGWSAEDYVVKSSITTTPVTNKFIIGDQVRTTAKINVRATAGGRRVGSQNRGATGIVIGGPVQAQGYTWWQVNYDSGVDGWSVEDFLIKR